ncbi:hypothetical protein ADT28_08035 [Xylella fastidiosa]|nr:hypothetical protein OY18_02075 [Xylella fastidiosa]ALR02360.1 hypothetical protein OY18_09210 [Xylella fastidiosa]KXB20247.1 hypothetical protein ADT28_08035 [Xylella fastidiosa]
MDEEGDTFCVAKQVTMELSLQCRQVFGEAAFLKTGRGQPITHRKTGAFDQGMHGVTLGSESR